MESRTTRHNNPHHWLEQDILQIAQYHYTLFQNLSRQDDTIP